MSAALPSARTRSDCATRRCRASKASISAAGAICRSPFSGPGTDRDDTEKIKAALQGQDDSFAQSVAGSIRDIGRMAAAATRARCRASPHAGRRASNGSRFRCSRSARRSSSMFFADGAATINSKRLPHILVEVSNWLTDFGKSQWFLWPAALVLAACALAGTSRALTRTQHRVLAAIAVRAQFVFIAVAVPGPRRPRSSSASSAARVRW